MDKIKVIASDLDGTFFYPKKRIGLIDKKNAELVRKFIDDGNRFLLVTSRDTAIKKRIEKRLNRKVDMLGCNGSFIMLGDEMIKEEHFDNKRLEEVLDYIFKNYNPHFYLLTSRKYTVLMPLTFKTWWYWLFYLFQGALHDPYVTNTKKLHEELKNGYIYKTMLMVGLSKKRMQYAKKMVDELTPLFPDMTFSWCNQMIEITPKGCSKSNAISFYLDYEKISHDNVYVVGDSGNDISMFEDFPEHSYCMSHAQDSVKKKAKHIIKRFHELEKELYPSADSPKE